MTHELQHFFGWGQVPTGTYMTATQLKNLDLPRQPGGPVRATVKAEDPTGRRGNFNLYLISESVPTSATGLQLEAAAARRTAGPGLRTVRRPPGVSVHPQRPLATVPRVHPHRAAPRRSAQGRRGPCPRH